MKITSEMKNIFSTVCGARVRGLWPQGYRHSASGGSKPQAPAHHPRISQYHSPEIARVRLPSPQPRRGPTHRFTQHCTTAKPWLALLFLSLLCCINLPAQWTPDSLCKAYDLAEAQYNDGNFESVDSMAPIITKAALQIGDTFVACKALNLHAAAHEDEPKLALPSLEMALALHEQAWGNMSILYYKMLAYQSRMYIDLGRVQQSLKCQIQLQQMETQFLRNHPQLGVQPVFDERMQNVYWYEDNGMVASAIEACEDVLAFASKYNKDLLSQRLLADAHSRLSQNFRKAKNLPQAASHNREALRLLKGTLKEDAETIKMFCLQYEADYCPILRDAGRYEEALQRLSDVRDSLKIHFPERPMKFAANDANVGYVFIKMGRLQEAWERMLAARAVFAAAGGGAYFNTAKMDISLADICGKQARYAEETQYALRAIDILHDNDILKGGDCAQAWREAALGYLGLGKQDSASRCIEQARLAAMPSTQYDPSGALNAAAQGYVDMESKSTAQNQSGDQAISDDTPHCATWWLSQAPNCKEIEYLDSAIHCLQRAIHATNLHPNQHDGLHQKFEEIDSQPEFLASLNLMGHVHERLYHRTGCLEFLHLATAYYNRSAQMIAFMDATRLNFGASYFKWENLWKDNYAILESAIRCGVQLNALTGDMQHLHTAYVVADMGKARLLSKSQLFFSDNLSSLVPADVQQTEKILLQTIEIQRKRNQDGQWSPTIARLESQMVQFKAYLRRQFPQYYQLKYENQAHFEIAEAAMKTPLRAGSASLAYFVGSDNIYAFLRTADTLIVAIIPDVQKLAETTAEFVASIQREDSLRKRSSVAEFAPMAMYLWRKLLPFPKPTAPVQQVLIIPDGFLHSLPFAALIRPDCDFDPCNASTEPPYLRNFIPIAQDFSSVSHFMTQQRLQPARPIEAIDGLFPRPQYSYRDSLPDTIIALDPPLISHELQALESTGLIQSAERPTIAAFLAALQKYGLIEIKTHGFTTESAEGPDAYILLEDAQGNAAEFHLRDLFGLANFQTRMLILNACATAKGPYQPGEGPISLARSFRQAGCPSLLTNLWDAGDEANTDMLKAYYAALLRGATTDQALQAAQGSALSGGVTKHPFFWAGMTVYGVVEGVGF
jgi:CHAT domain-containing protein